MDERTDWILGLGCLLFGALLIAFVAGVILAIYGG